MSAAIDIALEQDPGWLTTRQAAKLLSISLHMLRNHVPEIRDALRHKVTSSGLLWFRRDVEALIETRKRYSLRTIPAARVLLENRKGAGVTVNQ